MWGNQHEASHLEEKTTKSSPTDDGPPAPPSLAGIWNGYKGDAELTGPPCVFSLYPRLPKKKEKLAVRDGEDLFLQYFASRCAH